MKNQKEKTRKMVWKLGLDISGFIGSSVPKARATILGIPVVGIVVHLGLYGVPLFSETITSEE